MRHTIAHRLSAAEAVSALHRAAPHYAELYARYRPAFEWVDPTTCRVTVSLRGIPLAALIEVRDRAIDVDVEVPLMLRPLQRKALSIVEEHVRRWLSAAPG